MRGTTRLIQKDHLIWDNGPPVFYMWNSKHTLLKYQFTPNTDSLENQRVIAFRIQVDSNTNQYNW